MIVAAVEFWPIQKLCWKPLSRSIPTYWTSLEAAKSNGTAGIWPVSPPIDSRSTPPWRPSRRFLSCRSVSDMRSS